MSGDNAALAADTTFVEDFVKHSSRVLYILVFFNSHNNFTDRNCYPYFSDKHIKALKGLRDFYSFNINNDLLHH